MAGAFIVYRDKDDSRDIHFQVASEITSVPKEQLSLKAEIESVLTVARILFPNESDFENYFRPLLSLAQPGLVGDHAQPELAVGALSALKNEITAREGGKIKNRYMKSLGKHCLYIGGPILLLAIILYTATRLTGRTPFSNVGVLNNFLFLWAGCMVGVWLSFGARKTFLRFEDLHIPEEDRLEPAVRLFFAGLLSTILGLLFSLKVVTITLGAISSEHLNTSVRVAVLIGFLGGFSEKGLSSAVAKQASHMLQFR